MTITRALQVDATTGNGSEIGLHDLANAQEWAFFIEFGAGTSAGAVQLEEAMTPGYTGTWSALGSAIAWAAASRVHVVRNSGVGRVIRARISTNIVGGVVNVMAVGR